MVLYLSEYDGPIPTIREIIKNLECPRSMVNRFLEVSFVEQNNNISSAYDAGALHLGYGVAGYTYIARHDNEGRVFLNRDKYP